MKILLAPVQITPTKPLTPTHVKGLVWLDTFYKATSRLHEVTYLSNRITYDTTTQTLGFWEYLDRKFPDRPGLYDDKSDLWIAEQYLRCHAERFVPSPDSVTRGRERIERERWLHPASARILTIWEEQFRRLAIHDPGFRQWLPFEMSEEELYDLLRGAGVLLDARSMGGGIYLDLTDRGIPLRQIADEHGVSNYIVQVLRELIPHGRRHDRVILAFDEKAVDDYKLIEKVLILAGVNVHPRSMSRVPLEGVTGTARAGGWERYTVDKILARYQRQGDAAVRLALRLYFILQLGLRSTKLFRLEALDEAVAEAEALLSRLPGPESSPAAAQRFWGGLTRPSDFYVDPLRFTRTVIKEAPRAPVAAAALREVFCS
jgi:hypothetical protein